jgi:hypothetical protein
MDLPMDHQQDRVVSSSSRYDHPAFLRTMGHLNIVWVAIHLQPSRPKREYSRPHRFHVPPRTKSDLERWTAGMMQIGPPTTPKLAVSPTRSESFPAYASIT